MTHKIVIGLGFGDEGKGSAVDWLCTEEPVSAVIRYNGGPQAAHNVVLADGRHHTFAQFGSGTFRGVPTHLSEHMLVNPLNMVKEAEHVMSLGFPDPFKMTTVSEDALLVTPVHVAANRHRERLRNRGRHGSCGEGVGETRGYALAFPEDALHVKHVGSPHLFNKRLRKLIDYYVAEFGDEFRSQIPELPYDPYFYCLEHRLDIVRSSYIEKLLNAGPCVFEGAQGVLLDENYGFHPYTTWTDTTSRNAEMLLKNREFTKIGITRTYHTRHGAGPFPSEESTWAYPKELHNGIGEWQGAWRVGDLDMSLLDYAIRATERVDEIMLTFCDIFTSGEVSKWREITKGYYTAESWAGIDDEDLSIIPLPRNREEQEKLTLNMGYKAHGYDIVTTVEEMCDSIEEHTDMRPTILSFGPMAEDKHRVEVPLLHA